MDISEEYVSIRANIINVSVSDNSSNNVYFGEIIFPKEKQLSFQLANISSLNSIHVLKKVDEDRANAQLQKIVKDGYLNIDIKDTFFSMKMKINKNTVTNLTSYIVPREKTFLTKLETSVISDFMNTITYFQWRTLQLFL